MSSPPQKVCSSCHARLPITDFAIRTSKSRWGNPGELSSTCKRCRERNTQNKARKRKQEQDDLDEDLATDPGWKVNVNAPVTSLEEYLTRITESATEDTPSFKFGARVDGKDVAPTWQDNLARAKTMADLIWQKTSWRWIHENTQNRARNCQRFAFSCAQSDDRERETKTPRENGRDTRRMDRFGCHGWMYITVDPKSTAITIQIKHEEHHHRYLDLSLPEKWKEYIEANAHKQTPHQIYQHILREEAATRGVDEVNINFKEKSVYYYWHVVSQKEWKQASDPIESAKKFLSDRGKEHQVALLDVKPAPGVQVVAFQVTDFMKTCATRTRELAMDSTFGTNENNCELFAAVAGVEGSGIPLAYCLIQTSPEAGKGAKEETLKSFLHQLRKLGVNPEYTLTDKDWSEINAMRAVWPRAKHQLCFWHALHALKQRLAKNKTTPASYNVESAVREFSFISRAFVPAGQRELSADVIPPPPDRPFARIRLTVGGRPLPITPAIPAIRIRRPANFDQLAQSALDDVLAESDITSEASDESTYLGGEQAEVNAEEHDEEEDELAEDAEEDGWDSDDTNFSTAGDAEDFRAQVDKFASSSRDLDRANDNDPSEHGPRSADKNYIFCPAPHRLPILRLFAKHASQHPLLPERHGRPRTSELIRRDAVSEMYDHCHRNHLCEVWAYLWTQWYAPDRWVLWARSAHAASIPVHRTTMVVEALWRNLKRLVLHMYNRPRVDLAAYVLITQSIPPYRITLRNLLQPRDGGRPQALTNMQVALKRAWNRLSKTRIKGTYNTDLAQWTCDCGSQKYHANLLCKHLVQAVGPLEASWWPTITRYNIPPFYTVPINSAIADPPQSNLDRPWLDGTSDAEVDLMLDTETSSLPDITSSPNKAPHTGRDGVMRTRAGGGAGFESDEDVAKAQEAVRLMRYLADSLERQLENSAWLCRALRIIRPVLQFARDVEHHDNRRTMPITNGRAKDRRTQASSLIGYWHRSAREP